jgi:hypothetical protein
MQRCSETIGAIASALAKAQIEIENPEKSLTRPSGPRSHGKPIGAFATHPYPAG